MILGCLDGEASPQEICRRGLDVAHPDVRHLGGIGLDLRPLSVLPLPVELRLVGRKIRRFLILLVVLLLLLYDWNERLDEREILLCLGPWRAPCERFAIGGHGLGIFAEMRERVTLVNRASGVSLNAKALSAAS